MPLTTSSILIVAISFAIPILDAKRMSLGSNVSASVSVPCSSAAAASSGLSNLPACSQSGDDVSEASVIGTSGFNGNGTFGGSPVCRSTWREPAVPVRIHSFRNFSSVMSISFSDFLPKFGSRRSC